jgi:hypothetical protein
MASLGLMAAAGLALAMAACRLSPVPASDTRLLVAASPQWMGGDGAFSVPLTGRARLWLFGDTWIRLPGGGIGMASNTVGLQRGSCQAPLDAYWGGDPHNPGAIFHAPGEGQWLWPAGGLLLEGDLFLFLHRLARRPSGGPWEFRLVGTDLFRIANPRAPPRAWVHERAVLPWEGETLLMGLSPVVQGAHALIFGTRPAPGGRELILGRIPLQALRALDFGPWEFLAQGGGGPRWVDRPGDAVGLFQGIGTEFTVSREPAAGGWLCVYTPGGISPEIVLRRAPAPQGPWSPPRVIHRCPEASDPDLYCYGAKHHPECGPADGQGLWVTYTVNRRDGGLPGEHLAKPRWVWVPHSDPG